MSNVTLKSINMTRFILLLSILSCQLPVLFIRDAVLDRDDACTGKGQGAILHQRYNYNVLSFINHFSDNELVKDA